MIPAFPNLHSNVIAYYNATVTRAAFIVYGITMNSKQGTSEHFICRIRREIEHVRSELWRVSRRGDGVESDGKRPYAMNGLHVWIIFALRV